MDVSHAIQMKRAIRQFKPQPLAKMEVEAILNAGRRAQSSKNSQPWNFIAIQEADLLKELSELGDISPEKSELAQ